MWEKSDFDNLRWKYLEKFAKVITPEFVKNALEEYPELMQAYEEDEFFYMQATKYPDVVNKVRNVIGDKILGFHIIGFIQDVEEFRGNEIVHNYGNHTFAELITSAIERITECIFDEYAERFLR